MCASNYIIYRVIRFLPGELRRKELEAAVDPVDHQARQDSRAEPSPDRGRRVSPVQGRRSAVRLLHIATRVPADGGPRGPLEHRSERAVGDPGRSARSSDGITKVRSEYIVL